MPIILVSIFVIFLSRKKNICIIFLHTVTVCLHFHPYLWTLTLQPTFFTCQRTLHNPSTIYRPPTLALLIKLSMLTLPCNGSSISPRGSSFFDLGMNFKTGKKNVEETPYSVPVPSSKSKGLKNEEVFEVCRALLCSRNAKEEDFNNLYWF